MIIKKCTFDGSLTVEYEKNRLQAA